MIHIDLQANWRAFQLINMIKTASVFQDVVRNVVRSEWLESRAVCMVHRDTRWM